VIDLEPLLAPTSADSPCGPDLSYDAEFHAMERAAEGKPEQQFGEKTIPGVDPDWPEVQRCAQALLTRSKDVRPAVMLMRALTRTRHMEGMAAGLTLVCELLSRYWECAHPQLDPDDLDGAVMRLNALAPLADSDTFLRDLRNAFLVEPGPHGRVPIRDILIVAGKLPSTSEATMSAAEIAGIARAAAAQNPGPFEAVLNAGERAKALETLLTEKGVLQQAPDLRPFRDLLQAIIPICREALSGESAVQPDGQTQTHAQAQGAPEPGIRASAPAGQIASREDAVRVLEIVAVFIERSEPSNPAPLFIRRAQRLMSRNFVEIIEELAPDSLSQIQKLAGLRSE
jgi:type VI secretion system protein ImpA